MGQDTFYEISRRSITMVKNDGIFMSWHDSILNVRTDKGMTFYEFSYNLDCLDKELDIVEHSIPSSCNSPALQLCQSKFINLQMKNYDYTEMILDSSFWPHNKALSQEMTSISMSSWSPPFFIENKRALAILNSIGGVEILIQKINKWDRIFDLSENILENLTYKKTPQNFEELKKSVYTVETSAISWAPKPNNDKSCYFITAQKNSVVLFWQIFSDLRTPVLKGSIQCAICEIKNLLWIPRTLKIFWLICTNIIGQVYVLEFELKNDEFRLINSHLLWQYKDNIIASYLNYTMVNDKVVVIYSKHRHLVAQALDDNCKVISQYVNNINDQRITEIVNSLNSFYLATINVKIFKLKFSLHSSNLSADFIPVELKDQFPTCELYGLSFSKTNTLYSLAIVDRKLFCRKETQKVDIVFLTTESKLDSLIPKLINNPTKKFTDYWDCVEVLRYKTHKTKKMPDLDFNSLFAEASNDSYKLKLYLILLIFFLNMKKIARISSKFTLPELSIETVKEKILLLHAQSRIKMLYETHKKNRSLSDLEHKSLYGCVKYLEVYSKKHKANISIDKKTSSIVKKDVVYVCQSCDENVSENFTCKHGHLNAYCMLSFTPIDDAYLVCRCCNKTARKDMCVDIPLCVFCDQFLVEPE